MNCPYCDRLLKTHDGMKSHIRDHIADYQHRLGFWDEYNEAVKRGFEGTPERYAEERITGSR